MRNEDIAREQYLKQFERQNPVSDVFGGATKSTGDKIVELMKTTKRMEVFNMLTTRLSMNLIF